MSRVFHWIFATSTLILLAGGIFCTLQNYCQFLKCDLMDYDLFCYLCVLALSQPYLLCNLIIG